MDNHYNNWTTEEESNMISLLAQTKMSSSDCDLVFATMLKRSPNAIFMRRVQIGKRMIRNGHPLSYLCTLLHLKENDIIESH